MREVINFSNVSKVFKIPKRKSELSKAKQRLSFFYREWKDKVAVKDVSFSINKGEFVGYIGPNGAGKSTTIKLLTGILTPTSGDISVLGYNPIKDRLRFAKNIGVVFGQRRNLEYNIPIRDSYRLFRPMYDISEEDFSERLRYLVDVMDVKDIMETPFRKLSLGESMRAELVAAFLHKPKIVFLDEPTIGLDIIAKHRIRDFLSDINKREKVTIILTTHDMGDVEELARRIILIDHGKKMYDGRIRDFKDKYANFKIVEIVYRDNCNDLVLLLEKMNLFYRFGENNSVSVRFPLSMRIKDFLKEIVDNSDILDLKIEEPLLENVVKNVYENKDGNSL